MHNGVSEYTLSSISYTTRLCLVFHANQYSDKTAIYEEKDH